MALMTKKVRHSRNISWVHATCVCKLKHLVINTTGFLNGTQARDMKFAQDSI